MIAMIIFFLNFWAFVFLYGIKIYDKHIRLKTIDKFIELSAIFDRAREISYQKIYKDKLITYLASDVNLGNKEFEVIRKEYITSVFVVSGSEVIQDLVLIYGSIDAITSFLANDIFDRLSEDELKFKSLSKTSKIL